MPRAIWLFVLVALSGLVSWPGCTSTDNGLLPLDVSDEASFAASVQPYVGLRCGSLDCHGDPGRPLRIYAEDGLRAADDLREQPIAAEEIQANVLSFAGVSPEARNAATHLAITKGLAVDAGGLAHVGGDIWPDTSADGYLCLASWLDGRTQEVAEPCSRALDEFTPPAGAAPPSR